MFRYVIPTYLQSLPQSIKSALLFLFPSLFILGNIKEHKTSDMVTFMPQSLLSPWNSGISHRGHHPSCAGNGNDGEVTRFLMWEAAR